MPKIAKIGNLKFHCLTSYEADRLPNIVEKLKLCSQQVTQGLML